ncbi:hypothetical protein LCGC14_2106450 [marine sediment metagenome]|uniref:Uncharacterized protein n=1 Tax=marine sediment metagenome TaxID=412755 RepID=A0A0F9E8M6_9ZZZZ
MPATSTLHQFSAGLNSLQNVNSLPFPHPTQNGWKVYCENLTIGATYADDAYWNITDNTGSLAPGAAQSMVITGDGSVFSGYSLRHVNPSMQFVSSSKEFYLETRLMLTATSIPDNAVFVGYTSDNEAMTTTAVNDIDGGHEALGFGMVTQDTGISFYSREDNTMQTISMGGPFTTAVYTTLQCYYDGGSFNLYRDNCFISKTAKTKLNADEGMSAQIFYEAVNAAANTLSIQYLLLAVEL